MSLLEAMASGLPIVASEVSGTVQAIVPSETVFLVPPADVGGVARAISQLLSDGERALVGHLLWPQPF